MLEAVSSGSGIGYMSFGIQCSATDVASTFVSHIRCRPSPWGRGRQEEEQQRKHNKNTSNKKTKSISSQPSSQRTSRPSSDPAHQRTSRPTSQEAGQAKRVKSAHHHHHWVPFGDHRLTLERYGEDQHGPCAKDDTHTSRRVEPSVSGVSPRLPPRAKARGASPQGHLCCLTDRSPRLGTAQGAARSEDPLPTRTLAG